MPAVSHRVTHLVAHRGNAAEFPENTLPALRSACELGVRFALLDVQLAADEVPVVSRDVALAGTRLPSLAAVVALLAEHPKLTLLLELGGASLARFGVEVVVGRVHEALKGVRAQCVPVARDLGAVHLARVRGAPRVGWVLPACDGRARLKYEAFAPDFLLIDAARLPRGAVRLWRGPWRWVVLGVADADEAHALARRGADFVATAAVGPLSAALRGRARID